MLCDVDGKAEGGAYGGGIMHDGAGDDGGDNKESSNVNDGGNGVEGDGSEPRCKVEEESVMSTGSVGLPAHARFADSEAK